jgi:N-methylhydantoinase B
MTVASPAMAQPGRKPLPEPIFREILKGTFAAMVREMSVLIERTSMSPIIREKQDYAVGFFDVEGKMVLAQFLMQGPGMIEPILAKFPVSEMRPGDVYCYNDPYISNGAVGHVPDLVFTLPVFDSNGGVRGFIALFGHFWDIGGMAAGGMSPHATEVFHEGVIIPPLRLARDGEYIRDIFEMFMRNTRFPHFLDGDVRACVSACRLGVVRIESLFGQYGADRVMEGSQFLITQSETASRAILRQLVPQGRWHGSDRADSDGFSSGPFDVKLEVVREGDRIAFDLTETSDQAHGSINFILHPGILTTVLLGRILQSYDPTLVLNEGVMAAVNEIRLRPGSLLSPRFPAGVALRALSRNCVTNAILEALSAANPDKAPAPSATYGIITFRARDQETGKLIYCFEGMAIGMGARPWADGIDSVYLIGQKNNPVEWLEAEYPLRIRSYAIAPDSGGPGKRRGGVGIVREIEVLLDQVTLCSIMIYVANSVGGAAGGKPGSVGSVVLNPGTPQEKLLPAMSDNTILNRGDVVQVTTPGGGGWGNPLTREPEMVARDLRRGYVSRAAARRDYGVVFQQGSFHVDHDATSKARSGENKQ